MTVKFKPENETVNLPVKGTEHAACYDVYAYRINKLDNGKVEVDFGFSTEIPVGFKAVVVPRSNLTKHNWIINNQPCQIDCDFRGNWKAIFTPISFYHAFPYKEGERVAQMFIERVIDFYFEIVEELSTTARGEGGFGHTGLN